MKRSYLGLSTEKDHGYTYVVVASSVTGWNYLELFENHVSRAFSSCNFELYFNRNQALWSGLFFGLQVCAMLLTGQWKQSIVLGFSNFRKKLLKIFQKFRNSKNQNQDLPFNTAATHQIMMTCVRYATTIATTGLLRVWGSNCVTFQAPNSTKHIFVVYINRMTARQLTTISSVAG